MKPQRDTRQIEFALPREDEHVSILGRNGTGKSQFGAWLLSMYDLTAKPTVILDYKGEELFNALDRVREIGFEVPRQAGLYILHSRPDLDEETESWLWQVWERGNIRLFIDEGYMVPMQKAYRSLLTQGRSKRIPVITLSQRPVEIDRFAFSEASHIVAFHLNDQRDDKTVSMFTPRGFSEWLPAPFDKGGRLPDFHSRWYSVKRDAKWIMRPVPDADTIIADIDAQLEPKVRWL